MLTRNSTQQQAEHLSNGQLTKYDRLLGLTLISLWLLTVLFIHPVGNFPLNDDWAYSLPVKWLVEQRRLAFTDWQFMTLIGQVLFGSLFTLPTGFSFTVLRLSTLLLGLVGVLSTYYLARLANGSCWLSFIAALVLLCNPIYLLLSSTFMTDVPFFAVSLLSIVLLTLAWQRNSHWFLILGWLAVAWSCSIRQTGLGIALGFTISVLLNSKFHRRWLWGGILPSVALLVLVLSYPKILGATIGLPSMYEVPTNMMKQALGDLLKLHLGVLLYAAKNLFLIFIYLGFLLLPFTIAFPHKLREDSNSSFAKKRLRITILGTLSISSALFAVKWLMPMTQNTLINFGLGLRTLPGSETLPRLPVLLWFLMTAAGVFGAFTLLSLIADVFGDRVTQNDKSGAESEARNTSFLTVFLILTLVIYNLPFLLIYTPWFDRYIILNTAIFSILIIHNIHSDFLITRQRMTIASIIIIFYLSFGVAGTHDYLEWNRQRWVAIEQLITTRGVDPALIDGGFEYNNYQPRISGNQSRPPDQVDLVKTHALYRLAFSDLPGYNVLEKYPCKTWLWGAPQNIFVLSSPNN